MYKLDIKDKYFYFSIQNKKLEETSKITTDLIFERFDSNPQTRLRYKNWYK